jgi:hypothetical protein
LLFIADRKTKESIMKSARYLCPILFLATALVAQTGTTAKPNETATITAADVQALKDAIAAQQAMLQEQQKQIQELRDELHHRDQPVQQAQATPDSAGKVETVTKPVETAAAQPEPAVTAVKADASEIRPVVSNAVATVQEPGKPEEPESPMALRFRGITLTPGGYLAAETVWRSRALAGDVATPFNSITMPGASQSSMSEFFGSARQSRVSLLTEGRLKSAKLTGYVESDFLSSGTTSNNNQSNSYTMRLRQAWAQAALDSGWVFTGGQMWSLATEFRQGLDPRTQATPITIDTNYNVGLTFARQYGFRVVKNIGNKISLGVSVEDSQATITSHSNGPNFLVGSAGTNAGLYNAAVSTCTTTTNVVTGAILTTCSPLSSYSFNPAPDVIAKVAFEPGIGHYEIFGVYSRFRDRVYPCGEASPAFPCGTITSPSATGAYNSSRDGGGIGANARWSFINKHFDVGVHGFAGNGEGRYGTSGLPDASVHANGTLDLIRVYQGLGTIEWHGPKLDLYLYGGTEYAGRAADYDPNTNPITGKTTGFVGYGSPFFNNSGCFSETTPQNGSGFLPGSLSGCTADTRFLVEGTAGLWFRFYDGAKERVNRGRIQWGPQFSYVERQTWSGANGIQPHGLDVMVYTSLRYYLP